jgi:protein-tyrosine phosphatase
MNPFWVETGGGARLAIIPRPRGGDWLEDEVRLIKLAGIDVLVSMLQSGEAVELGLAMEAQLCETAGIAFRSFPIPDRQTPSSMASFAKFIEILRAEVHAGHSVAVHCRASIGRSSLLLAGLLITDGLRPSEAFRRLTNARGLQVPDTPDQVRWIEQFASTQHAPAKSPFRYSPARSSPRVKFTQNAVFSRTPH